MSQFNLVFSFDRLAEISISIHMVEVQSLKFECQL